MALLNDLLSGLNKYLEDINKELYSTPIGKGLLKSAKNLASETVKTADIARNRRPTPINLLKTLAGETLNLSSAPFEAIGTTERQILPEQVQQIGVQTPLGKLDIGGLADFLAQAAIPVGGGTSKAKSLLNKGKVATKVGEEVVSSPFNPNVLVPKGATVPIPEEITTRLKSSGAVTNLDSPIKLKSIFKDEKGGVNLGANLKIPEVKGGKLLEELIPSTKPQTTTIDDTLIKANKEIDKKYGRDLVSKVTRFFPYSDESAKVASTGDSGKEIVMRARRVNARTIAEKAKSYRELEATGIRNLSPEEVKNLTLAREGREGFMNDKVKLVSQTLDDSFIGRAPTELDIPRIEQYAPRLPNEAGKKWLGKNTNQIENQLIEKLMREQGITDKAQAVKILRGGQKKAFFERQRLLENLPDEYRDFSIQPWLKYAEEYARRKAVTNEFGLGDQVINKLKNEVDPDHLEMVDKYLNRVRGNITDLQELKGVSDFIKNSMILSKLTPITTLANELQAAASSFLTDGVSGIIRTMKPGGKKLATEFGLDDIKGKFGDFIDPKTVASRWMKVIGMDASESRGIQRSAKATWDGIDTAWKKLTKNPQDLKAKKYLNNLGMYVDDKQFAEDLAKGTINAEEKAIGAIEGARQKMFFRQPGEVPPWANSPIGSSAYIFHNYVLHQLNLLRKAPKVRQLAYIAAFAPVTGLPAAYLRNVVLGKEQPSTVAEMWQQGSRYGAASPFELNYTIGTDRGQLSTILGGFSPYANIVRERVSGTREGVAKEAFKAAPIPLGGILSQYLFPSKQSNKPKLTQGTLK